MLHWPDGWLVNIDSGNGRVRSGNKPLPEPIATMLYNSYMRLYASVS